MSTPFSPAASDTVQVGERMFAAPFLHVVRPGDGLDAIAERHSLSIGDLRFLNEIEGEDVRVGQVLVVGVPPADWDAHHTVEPGHTLSGVASAYGLATVQLQRLNALPSPDVAVGQRLAVPRLVDPAGAAPGAVARSTPAPTPTDTPTVAPTAPPTAAALPPDSITTAALPSDTTGPENGAANPAAAGNGPPGGNGLAQTIPADSVAADSVAADSVAADSVAADSVAADSVAADSVAATTRPDSVVAAPDTSLAARYIPAFRRDAYTASLRPRVKRPMQPRLGSYWRHEIRLDSTGQRYIAREIVAGADVRYPLILDPETYRQVRLEEHIRTSFRSLADARARRLAAQRRRGFGVNLVVPGGRESAFTTIFGKPEVDLRVNGQANIDAGFIYQKSDLQVSATGRGGRVDPDFGQNIRLSITGSIGDKLRVDVNWDTERTFDFENQLKLEYTGYEDEIVQKVVAGNVFLQTPSSLIQGGQSLFGIRSDFQLGGIRLTTVASQQEGESDEIAIEGGSQTTEFDLKPTDYEDDTHYFMGYFFRDQWEPAHNTDPTQIIVANNRLSDFEVWRLERTITGKNDPNVREAIALVDLGEDPVYTAFPDSQRLELPNPNIDRYTIDDIERLRTQNNILDFLRTTKQLQESDFQAGDWRKLQEGRDYDIDEYLGTISLRSRLTEDEALAVAYKYPGAGAVFGIGDFASETSGRLVLKLLRKSNHNPATSTWPLTMRNVYKIPGRGFSPTEFQLDIVYERPGQPPQKTVPGSTSRQTLLQLLGLDRLSEDRSPQPDNRFDFQPWIIQPETGRLYFPYLRPFADRIATATSNPALIFADLYRLKKAEAIRDSQHDVYRIRGEYKSAVQSIYNIPAFGIVEGSVRVTSGGVELTPNSDYIVDYATGQVNITNSSYLAPGRDVNITFERSQFAAIQKKTLVGMRADYAFRDNLALGATMMRLSEKPLIDKYRIGEEPLRNVIWGVDGSLDLEPRWLTRIVDALPLVQTKAPSSVSFKGEFAQLLPGSPQTLAFRRTRDQLRDDGLDFSDDELGGISYIDDFESVENSINLNIPTFWQLSSVPDSIAVDQLSGAVDDSVRTTYRGTVGWYVLPIGSRSDLFDNAQREQPADNLPAIRPIHINEVFPNKDVSAETAIGQLLSTFDVFFDPTTPGPYNYTDDFRTFTDPFLRKQAWGGMMQRLPEGYTDFNLNNIEFIEFIVAPHARTADGDAGEDAYLLIDIGSISEDVIPNEDLNTEDGLSLSAIDRDDFDAWSRLTTGIQDALIRVDENTGRTEDLGLDGWPSTTAAGIGGDPYETSEQIVFQDFLQNAQTSLGGASPLYQRLLRDPSGDDYHHFLDDAFWRNPEFFDGPVLLQERYTRYFPGTELNTNEAQREIAGNSPPVSGTSPTNPDSEDLNANATLDTENSYYQYRIPLSKRVLDELADPRRTDDFVVNKIVGSSQTGSSEWYTVRIPVRSPQRRAVGGIQDFTLIRTMRLWTTGHTAPVTLRFASFDLVGSQWQKSRRIGCAFATDAECLDRDIGGEISISTINNEESLTYRIPPGAVQSKIRLATGLQDAREQALLLRSENLGPRDERAIFYPRNQPIDLLKYGNIRMFVHGHGEGFDERGDVRLFMRFGLNETNDYYEYEQPITPSDPLAPTAEEVWQTNLELNGERVDLNSVFIKLSEFNKLKVARDDSLGFPVTREFVRGGFDFGPPGVRLKIKGNPSLSGVTTLVIGIRGDSLRSKTIDEVELWLNELRATEFDSESGWAAIATAQVRLADLASINANIRTQTDGFGPLSSELGDRQSNNLFNWSLTTNLNLHKFLPERYGWNFPLSYSIRDNQSTPRFSQTRGDIRLTELLEQIEENDQLDAAEKQARREEVLAENETNQRTRSFSIPLSKSGSRSRVVRNTVDAVAVNYSRSTSESSNPATAFNDSWQWSSSASYRLTSRKPRTFRPLWFFDALPLLDFIGKLRMSYLPQSFNLSGSANRSFGQSQERNRLITRDEASAPDSLRFQSLLRYPVRETHAFTHSRTSRLGYNPFTFLNLSYDSNVNQNLRETSSDTLFSVAYFDTANAALEIIPNTTLADAIDQGLVPEGGALELNELQVRPVGDVISRLVNGTGEVRTERYGQNFTGTFQPRLTRFKALDWITLRPLAYSGRFQWQNGPAGKNTGVSVSNNLSINTGIGLAPQDLFRKFGFYQNLEKQQRDAVNAKRAARARKTQARQTRRDYRRTRRDIRRVIEGRIDSLRALGYAERDTLLGRLDRDQRDALRDSLREEAERRFEAVDGRADSLRDAREPALDSLRAVHARLADSLQTAHTAELERLAAAHQAELDSIRSLEGTVIDSTLTLTGAALDSILTAKQTEFDSLRAVRAAELEQLRKNRAEAHEADLEAEAETLDQAIDEAVRLEDRLRRLRKAGVETLIDDGNAYQLAADSLFAITDSLVAAQAGPPPVDTPAPEAESGGGPLSFLSPTTLMRRLALAVTGIRDLSITYRGSQTGNSSNVRDEGYSLIDALWNYGPSIGYRLGLERRIDPTLDERFIDDPTLRVNDRLTSNTAYGAQASLQPTQTFRVEVSWDAQWDDRREFNYELGPNNDVFELDSRSGSNQATALSFGTSYVDFFERQLDTFIEDRNSTTGTTIGDANGDGRIVLTNETLVDDFQSTFINSFGQIRDDGNLPFPMPNWNVTYTGLSSLPIFRRLAQSATIRHGFSATYNTDFRSNADAGTNQTRPLRALSGGTVVPQTIQYIQPDISVGSVRVNQRFQPLLSLDVTWKGSLQTGVSWSSSRSYALSATSADVTTNETGELSVRAGWSKRGMRLPFMGRKRLNNMLRFSLTASRAENVELRYRLINDLQTFLSENIEGLPVDDFRDILPEDDEFLNPPPVSSVRLQLEPRISYTFSNRVSADFFVRYENLQSEGSRVPTTTSVKGGFNVRVSIANN